jgi:hypothetical protein
VSACALYTNKEKRERERGKNVYKRREREALYIYFLCPNEINGMKIENAENKKFIFNSLCFFLCATLRNFDL